MMNFDFILSTPSLDGTLFGAFCSFVLSNAN
jgi:hypothetical protein